LTGDLAARALARALREDRVVDIDLRDPPRLPALPIDHLAPLFSAVRGAPAGSPWLRLGAPPGEPGPPLPLTVIIPTEKPTTPWGVAALLAQRPAVQVVVVVNGPVAPPLPPGVRALRLPWRGHGPTRAAALAQVDTALVAFVSDDARPLGAGWAAAAVRALTAAGADGAVCRQVPWPDADPITRARIRRWTPPWPGPAPQADHVATIWRTAALRDRPLAPAPIAEDAWWSLGRRLVRAVGAPVLHSHPRRAAALFAREAAISAELIRMGRPPQVATLSAAVWASCGLLRHQIGDPEDIPAGLAELWGQWAGARRAAAAR
jgi:hypothetical protein